MATLYLQDGYKIGTGINSNTGQIKGEAIKTDNVSLVDALGFVVAKTGEKPPEGGIKFNNVSSSKVYLKVISNRKELRETMKVSASASIQGLEISGSAEAEFIQSTNFSSSSIHALIFVTVTTDAVYLSQPALTEEAFNLLKQEQWAKFEERYGPEYVAGIKGGGCLYFMLEITASDSEKSKAILAKIDAQYSGVVDAEASASFAKDVHSIDSKATTIITVYQVGGDPDQKKKTPITIEEAMERAVNFTGEVTAHPNYCQVVTDSYTNLQHLPYIDKEHQKLFQFQKLFLDSLGKEYEDLNIYVDDIDFVLSHFESLYESFKDLGVAYENKNREEIQKMLNDSKSRALARMKKISDTAIDCSQDSKKCEIDSSDFIKMKLPGGDLMYLKELEKNLLKLTSQVERLEREAVRYDTEAKIQSRSDSQFLVHEQATGSLTIALVEEDLPESNTPRFRFMIRKVIN